MTKLKADVANPRQLKQYTWMDFAANFCSIPGPITAVHHRGFQKKRYDSVSLLYSLVKAIKYSKVFSDLDSDSHSLFMDYDVRKLMFQKTRCFVSYKLKHKLKYCC